jgi:hypothetical protein
LADTLLAVKVRRILLPLVALAVFLAGAPVAAGPGVAVGAAAGRASKAPNSDHAPERDSTPSLTALPARHHGSTVATGAGRRAGDTGTRLVALGATDARLRVERTTASVDAEADARLLRASNTPCCVRGPPAAA